MRHGETAYNAENRLQGQRDIPLNARGRDQARAVGRTLRARIGAEIDRLEAAGAFFASPLERARETMELARAAMGLPPKRYRLDAALKEITFGDWEGLTWPEVRARDPSGVEARRADKWGFVPPGGESYAMLVERVRPWLAALAGDAFVVSHGGVARAFMTILAGVAGRGRRRDADRPGPRARLRQGSLPVDRVSRSPAVAREPGICPLPSGRRGLLRLARLPGGERSRGGVARAAHHFVMFGGLRGQLDHIAVRIAEIDRVDEAVVGDAAGLDAGRLALGEHLLQRSG